MRGHSGRPQVPLGVGRRVRGGAAPRTSAALSPSCSPLPWPQSAHGVLGGLQPNPFRPPDGPARLFRGSTSWARTALPGEGSLAVEQDAGLPCAVCVLRGLWQVTHSAPRVHTGHAQCQGTEQDSKPFMTTMTPPPPPPTTTTTTATTTADCPVGPTMCRMLLQKFPCMLAHSVLGKAAPVGPR